jgi:hypothetical protein
MKHQQNKERILLPAEGFETAEISTMASTTYTDNDTTTLEVLKALQQSTTRTTEQALQDGDPILFPTTIPADNGWRIPPAATMTNGWNYNPTVLSPPLSAVEEP